MESVLVASRSGLSTEPPDFPTLTVMASDPPGFERDGSRVYLSDPAAYLQDVRQNAAGQAALDDGLALLPGEASPLYREVPYAGGTWALRAVLTAWAASQEAVVWDGEDRPWPLAVYLAQL